MLKGPGHIGYRKWSKRCSKLVGPKLKKSKQAARQSSITVILEIINSAEVIVSP